VKTVECKSCGKLVTKTITRYNESIKNGWNFFCSRACRYGYQEKGVNIPCAQCQTAVRRTPAQIRQTKSNIFCPKSCAAKYNNSHKTYGTRRSKLEELLEQRLKLEFTNLAIKCNTVETIQTEPNFYFPELNLAIGLNGVFHYKPIYGKNKLQRIQCNDKQKLARCKEIGIELYVIDVSGDVYLNREAKEKYWTIVKGLVTSIQRRAGHTNVQVP
jgi:hypothetical protein